MAEASSLKGAVIPVAAWPTTPLAKEEALQASWQRHVVHALVEADAKSEAPQAGRQRDAFHARVEEPSKSKAL